MSVLALVAAALVVVGDGIPQPLTDTPGDEQRGRAIVADKQQGLCLLCHQVPVGNARDQGTLAGDLAGVGARLNAAQLRLRIADARRVEPDGLMPSLHRSEGFDRVGKAWRAKPVLDAQQVEDVVAYLQTLK